MNPLAIVSAIDVTCRYRGGETLIGRARVGARDRHRADVVLLVLAGLAGVLAATWPARRAARVDILAALAAQ
jgi:hypothetical protein